MFVHIFRYRLKCLLRDKMTVFWTLMFPLLLSVFFNLAFSSLNEHESFQPIKISVVDSEAYGSDQSFKQVLEQVSTGDDRLFDLSVVSMDEAARLLGEGAITGFVVVEPGAEVSGAGVAGVAGAAGAAGAEAGLPGAAGAEAGLPEAEMLVLPDAGTPKIRMFVNGNGLNQSILKIFLDDYIQTSSTVAGIIGSKADEARNVAAYQDFCPLIVEAQTKVLGKDVEALLADVGDRQSYLAEVPASTQAPDNTLIYFYSLIAMACFYGGFMGSREVTDIQASISPLAARVNSSPVHKLKAFLFSSSASLLIHITEMLIFLIFLHFVLGVEFGPKVGFVLLTTFVGSLAGLSFGAFISALVKKSENIKVAVILAVTMASSFLAGMMFLDMKYIVAQKLPLLSWLNPINLLTDAFYALYYFDGLTRYAQNIGVLLVFVVAFCAGTYLLIRRRKYASI